MKFKKLFLALIVGASCCCFASEAKIENAAPAVENVQAAAAPADGQSAAPAARKQQNSARKQQNSAKKQQNSWTGMLPMLILIAVMIFLFVRSNKKQQKQRQEMMDKMVKGAKVMLQSGVYGKVIEVKENDVVVEIAENTRVLVVKAGIANVINEDAKK